MWLSARNNIHFVEKMTAEQSYNINNWQRGIPSERRRQMKVEEEVLVLSGEPYLRDDVVAKSDPERYIWETELNDWAERMVIDRYVDAIVKR